MLNGEEDFPEGIAMEVYSLSEGKALRQFNLPFKEPALLARFMGHPLSHYGDSCPATKSTMFTPDPLLDIVGCVFFVHRGITQQFVAVMSVRQLIQLSTQDQQEGFRLEWSKWGKFAAQWLSHRVVRYVGFRATFGSQMLVKIRQFDDNGMWLGNSIALLDFNQRAIQRRKEKTEMGTRVHRIVADGITRNFLTFGMGWTSTLSFRAFVSCGMVTHSNFYLDANTIVGRTVGSTLDANIQMLIPSRIMPTIFSLFSLTHTGRLLKVNLRILPCSSLASRRQKQRKRSPPRRSKATTRRFRPI